MVLCYGNLRKLIQEERRCGLAVGSVGLILKGEVWIGWRAVCIKINSRSYTLENKKAQIVEFRPLSVVYNALLGKGVMEDSGWAGRID